LNENPFAGKSVHERARLLAPIITEAEDTKHRMRPVLQSMQNPLGASTNTTSVATATTATTTTSNTTGGGLIETVKEKATEVMHYLQS
jgi:hypothetical protein